MSNNIIKDKAGDINSKTNENNSNSNDKDIEDNNDNKKEDEDIIKSIETLGIDTDKTKEASSIAIDISKGSQASLAFQEKLQHILKSQEEMLQMTFATKEKLHSTNEIALDQIKNFEQNSKKYAGYLKLIKAEFTQISEIMKKIRKLKQ